MAKFFDIDDANSALPELRTILQTLRDERAQLIELRDEFARRAAQDATDAADSGEPGGEGSGSSGSAGLPGPRVIPVDEESPAAEERRRLRLRMQGVIDQMQALVTGRQVWLCWRLGEGDVDWWHELDEGFGGRRPLAELT